MDTLASRLADRRVLLTAIIVVVGAIMSFLSPYFLRIDNLLSMTQFGAIIGLLALGVSLVILGGNGGIDLSVGSMMSLSGVVMGLLSQDLGWSPWLSALFAIAAGALFGAVNAFLVTVLRLPALIATLGTLFLYGSAALMLTGGGQVGGMDRDGFAALGQSAILGVPTQVLLVVLPAFAIMIFVQHRMVYGRRIQQMGTNDEAARLVGVNVAVTTASLYVLSGVLSAVAAIVSNSWLLTARPNAGLNLELQAITIAVLGGIYIFGGRGHLSGVLLAVVLVVVLNSGLQLAGVPSSVQGGILGIVLVAAALLNNVQRRPRRGTPRAIPMGSRKARGRGA